jgi:hypothetical protein
MTDWWEDLTDTELEHRLQERGESPWWAAMLARRRDYSYAAMTINDILGSEQ